MSAVSDLNDDPDSGNDVLQECDVQGLPDFRSLEGIMSGNNWYCHACHSRTRVSAEVCNVWQIVKQVLDFFLIITYGLHVRIQNPDRERFLKECQ